MTYDPTKPDPSPSPAVDVAQIRTNFATWATALVQNHTAMNNRNQGDHEKVLMELQTNDPGVTEDLDVLYAKNATTHAGTEPQLFVQIPQFLPNANDWTQNPNLGMQLTYSKVNTAGPVYQSFLPGGYLLYFGSVSGMTTPNTSLAITVVLSPVPTKILLAIATPNTMTSLGAPIPFDVSTAINTITNDRFVINSTSNGAGGSIAYSFGWVAIAQN